MKKVAVVTALTILSSCARHNRNAIMQALLADESQWVRDYNSKDPARIASHYADDAMIMNPGGPPIRGREAARASYQNLAADPAFSLRMDPDRVEISDSGELGYVAGPYEMMRTDRKTGQRMRETGSFLTVYHRQGAGTWKAVADMATVQSLTEAPAK